jgi:hypothetical protein
MTNDNDPLLCAPHLRGVTTRRMRGITFSDFWPRDLRITGVPSHGFGYGARRVRARSLNLAAMSVGFHDDCPSSQTETIALWSHRPAEQ